MEKARFCQGFIYKDNEWATFSLNVYINNSSIDVIKKNKYYEINKNFIK